MQKNGDIHCWLVSRNTVVDNNIDVYVTSDEKKHADTLRHKNRKHEWLWGRALLRRCLSHYLSRDPLSFVFEKTEQGKPVLSGHKTQDGKTNNEQVPVFNISHGPRWVACAFAWKGCIGVDIDSEARRNRTDDIASHYFHPNEQAYLQGIQDASARRRAFFQLWTLKEAYLKSLGDGISGDRLKQTAFSCARNGTVSAAFSLPKGNWHFLQRQFDGDHHLALAYGGYECDTDNTNQQVPQYQFWQWDAATGKTFPFVAME